LSDDRKVKFAAALQPNYYEWDAVMNEQTSLAEWADSLPRRTIVISAADTVQTIRALCTLFAQHIPAWHYATIDHGGHMAALTSPR